MPSITPPKFHWEDLPCTIWNGIRAFSIFVPSCENDQNTQLPQLGITWRDSPNWIRTVETVNEPLKDWTLRAHNQIDQGRTFTYGPVLTAEQQSKPYQVYYDRKQHYWPTVLLKLWFEKHVINGQDVILDRATFRDGQTYPTTFEIKEFLTEDQWPASRYSKLLPITDTVRWNLGNNSGSFPECLHGDVTFQNFTASGDGAVLFGCGTIEKGMSGQQVKEFFPATTMTDWEKYPVEVVTNYEMGYWHITETWALPPIDDREDMT